MPTSSLLASIETPNAAINEKVGRVFYENPLFAMIVILSSHW